MIMLDNTVVNVALPSIQKDLRIGTSELEWVVNAYALTFGVLLLTGGKLADLFGRRAIFIVGLVIFTGASLWCGLSGGADSLIAARTVQGIGAALMNPATLSIITATFPPRQRGMAIGIWAGVSALALAIGPLVGGLLTQDISWGWIFFINIPVGVAGVLAARIFIDESKDTSREQRLDVPGLLSSGIGLFALTLALIETNDHAWGSAIVLSLFAVAVVALTVFVLLETYQRIPMLDLSLFRDRQFAGANTVMFMVGLAMFGIFFFNSLFLQRVLGYGAIKTGATFLPMTVLIIFVAPAAGKVADRVGPRWLMGGGMVLLTGSLLLFATLDEQPSGPGRRRRRHGDHDGADDGRCDGLGPRRQGRRRLRGDQQHAPGRRLPRDRDHGRTRRNNGQRPTVRPALRVPIRPGLPPRAPRRRSHPPSRRRGSGPDDPQSRARRRTPARTGTSGRGLRPSTCESPKAGD
jgi:EmrB/QacA subfamily drug resistance transporter